MLASQVKTASSDVATATILLVGYARKQQVSMVLLIGLGKQARGLWDDYESVLDRYRAWALQARGAETCLLVKSHRPDRAG